MNTNATTHSMTKIRKPNVSISIGACAFILLSASSALAGNLSVGVGEENLPSPLISNRTSAGVPLPSGWGLKKSDIFGTGASSTIQNYASLHNNYYEGLFYNRNAQGLVNIPNLVINNEQQTYVHFEQAVKFSSDHVTIQARGRADGSITSGEMVSTYAQRNFCIEARYKIPNVRYGWPAFWQYGADNGNDDSEIDVEQPVTADQGINDVTMHNHTNEGANIQIYSPYFTTQYMNYHNSAFDGSAISHTYTTCYNDNAKTINRYIDGKRIYGAGYTWNESLGGTGHGPDAATILNLAVGGNWPGNTPNPSSFSANFEIYSVLYYGP